MIVIPTSWSCEVMREYREGAQNRAGHIVNISCVNTIATITIVVDV